MIGNFFRRSADRQQRVHDGDKVETDSAATTGSQEKLTYEGHLESKERFAIQRYLLIIGKKKNMQVL